jgi:hypothetical protein
MLFLGKKRDEEEEVFEMQKQVDRVRLGRGRRGFGSGGTMSRSPVGHCLHTSAFWEIVREIFPMILYKPLLFLGLFTCIASRQ